ncbi:YIP1 family protein [Paenibacillus antri]|uniref:YIP1 family protein n=1 Tax=Paenibacillus antri TaxID=2582848 RepID=A0A5R9G515_9BACL|nr:Yip1 family protein [Paenibacillus antri]TLS50871.1 YIP1 family protein [Paenibacillus antri]
MRKERIVFPLQLIFRPFDGFWELKYDGKGSLPIAGGILALVFLAFVIQSQYGGFHVNDTDLRRYSSLVQLRGVVFPFVLWCVANWSLTTLMDGEGKFSEICLATAYATTPLALVLIPNTILSNFITLEESVFYYFLNSAAMLWFVFLLFVGTMTIHQYSAAKTLATIALTLVCMGFILFLGLLFFSLIQQMYSFAYTIYREITFR